MLRHALSCLVVAAMAAMAIARPLPQPPEGTVSLPPSGPGVAPEPLPAPPPDGGLLPAPVPPPKIWCGSFDAGFNGATGNSELFAARVGLIGDRKTDTNLWHTDFLYNLAKQTGLTTQNAMLLNSRDEILFPGSPWSVFGSTNIEYDELRLFKFRIGLYAGVGYQVVDDGITILKLRAGLGAVREIGGPRDRWEPEAVFGYDYKHKFSDRQSIVSTLDYYPRLDDFTQFRVRARFAYEIIIDPAMGAFLRLGAQSRYDSDPGLNVHKNDLSYFATVGMKF